MCYQSLLKKRLKGPTPLRQLALKSNLNVESVLFLTCQAVFLGKTQKMRFFILIYRIQHRAPAQAIP